MFKSSHDVDLVVNDSTISNSLIFHATLYSVQILFPTATCSLNSTLVPKVLKPENGGMATHLEEKVFFFLLPLKLLVSGEPPILISDNDNREV